MGKSGLPKDGKKRIEKWIAKYDPEVVKKRFEETLGE
jgi:hypothetical protein